MANLEPVMNLCGHYAGFYTEPGSEPWLSCSAALCPKCYIDAQHTRNGSLKKAADSDNESVDVVGGPFEKIESLFPGLMNEYTYFDKHPVKLSAIGWHFVLEVLMISFGKMNKLPKDKGIIYDQICSILSQLNEKLPTMCKYVLDGERCIIDNGLEILGHISKHDLPSE